MVTESSGSKSGEEGAFTGLGAGPGTPIPGSVAPVAPGREAGAPSQRGLLCPPGGSSSRPVPRRQA